jgi:hypothetical protein
MKKIYKYPLHIHNGTQYFEVHEGFKILNLKLQNDKPVLYAVVNPNNKLTTCLIGMVFTGEHIVEDIMDSWTYIDTFTDVETELVYHVFELKR